MSRMLLDEVPFEIVQAAENVGRFFAERNISGWKLGPCMERKDCTPVALLRALVAALDGAFISSWQTTAAWQQELDAAREWLTAQDKQTPTGGA